MSDLSTCPCGTDEHRTELAGDTPECVGCERFLCIACERWLPWDDGADDEYADLCDECAGAITARPASDNGR